MFAYLNQHPQMKLPDVKEIHFFDLNYSNGLDWYTSHFPPASLSHRMVTGEASPYYLFHPHVPERVRLHCPDVNILVMLRNPADRAYSHYMMQKRRQFDKSGSFEEAISLEDERLGGELEKIVQDPTYNSTNHQRLSYLARGFYFQQISRWLRFFRMDQCLFIRSENFFTHPEDELVKVYQFLKITEDLPSNLSPENTNKYPPMAEETRKRLTRYFEEDSRKLSELLGSGFRWND